MTWEEIKAHLDTVPGWLHDIAARTTFHLAQHQRQLGIEGDVLEFGVFRGKYLTLLAACASPEKATVVGVDAFLRTSVEPLDESDADGVEAEIRNNVGRFWSAPDRLHIVRADSRRLGAQSLEPLLPNGPTMISVDGGHDADCVVHDMHLSSQLLERGGFISADDVFNLTTPGVSEGLSRFLCALNDRGLVAFGIIYNKLFLCDPDYHQTYYDALTEFLQQNASEPFVQKTLEHHQANRDNRWEPRYFGSRVMFFV